MSDDLPPAPSPLPIVVVHVGAVLLHLLDGVGLIGFLLLGPAMHPAQGAPLEQTRVWLAGIGGFATLVTLFFSTVMALALYRVISLFLLRSGPGLIRTTMVLGTLLVHVVGCTAGIGGMGLAVAGTVFGEHGGPWTEASDQETNDEAVP